jgi:hypothetical protein
LARSLGSGPCAELIVPIFTAAPAVTRYRLIRNGPRCSALVPLSKNRFVWHALNAANCCSRSLPTDSFNIGKTHKRRFRTNPYNNGQKFWSGRETFLK